jgi:predicted AAA+ superfamily ATPase
MVKDSQIRESNQWWKARENIKRDEKITEWEKSTIRYDPRLRHKIRYDFEPDNTVVYTLRGPRQVGKTTLIKLQIRDFLIEGDVWPWNIFYYSFDLVSSRSELVEVIEAYLRLSKRHRKKSNRTYLFLDEVSSVSDWQKGIKWLIDNNRLENCTVLATGSQAVNILNATERLPGRKGRTTDPYDKLLIPMKFSEFVEIQDKEIAQFIRDQQLLSSANRKRKFMQLLSKQIPEKIDLLHNNFIDDLNDYLYEYLLSGGTPKIVDEKIKTNFISPDLYTDYLDGIKGDWGPQKNEALLKQFGGAIINSIGSSMSWDKLRQQAQLGGWTTAQDYALSLKDMSIITIIQRYGEKKKIPLIAKEKKFYFHDPFYLHLFNGWLNTKDPFELSEEFLANEINQSNMVEGVVADHLIRWAFSLVENKQGFDYFNHVFFWKDQKDKEVDFVLYQQNNFEAPLEVKYRNKVDARELGGLTSFLDETGVKSGIVLSKNELEEKQDYLILPTSVFLMLI